MPVKKRDSVPSNRQMLLKITDNIDRCLSTRTKLFSYVFMTCEIVLCD